MGQHGSYNRGAAFATNTFADFFKTKNRLRTGRALTLWL